jgi:hypothetical protein
MPGLQGEKIKDSLKIHYSFIVIGDMGAGMPRAGIEPTTLALGVLCSIQLSYRGALRIIQNN